jgi:glucokinase
MLRFLYIFILTILEKPTFNAGQTAHRFEYDLDWRGHWRHQDCGVLSSEPPVIIARREFRTLPEQGPDRALKLIQQGIHDLLHAQSLGKDHIAAIGVSCGGPLDRVTGTIQALPNLSTWVDVPITSILQRDFGCACRLENDANAGAVAEHRFAPATEPSILVFLLMGTGLGAGVILDGRLYHGGVGFCRRI